DPAAEELKRLLKGQKIGCAGLLSHASRATSLKTRVVAHTQQVVRIDRETRDSLDQTSTKKLLASLEAQLDRVDAVIICDYGKGVVSQPLLNELKKLCRSRAVWLSLDPKPTHHLDLAGISLITPNRKETFELARLPDDTRQSNPMADTNLMLAAGRLLNELRPAVLLITLGELGMLLC